MRILRAIFKGPLCMPFGYAFKRHAGCAASMALVLDLIDLLINEVCVHQRVS